MPTRVQVWQDSTRNAFRDLETLVRLAQDPNILTALSAIDDLIAQAAELRTRAVKEARLQGGTWEEVGKALRMKRQAAWDKYRAAVGEEEVGVVPASANGSPSHGASPNGLES